ncbi:MAG TPA: adenylate/guanylate cyclase domain-containing protein, partial [Candidatus Binataceae bacterium]|nr:adenylate/guanylate cyclase domain-containing protein [Candidatus Binataceae bacterium]
PPGKRFCGDCGEALQGHPAVQSSAPVPSEPAVRVTSEQPDTALIDGERKTVTALFADIKGSMDLMEDLDPEQARQLVDPALKLMINAAQRYDGYIVQSTGDGIFALFGAPVAHEDHPQRALYAALRMQEDMRRYSAKLREAGNPPVEARFGVNTGEVVVRSIATGSHQEYTPIGHSTSLAARMQALAPTGSIATTDAARRLCEGYFSFRSLGLTRIKGVHEPLEIFEVVGLGPLRTRLQRSASRGLTRFVGRQREIEAMKYAGDQARSGHGQIVSAVAEAGVGKSRLFFEFKAVASSGWTILEAFSVSHGKASSYLPIIDLLRGYFRIESQDDSRQRREKIAGKITVLDRALEDTLSYLYALLGTADDNNALAQMDAEVKQRRTLEAIKRIVLRESLNQPLILIFEDLHWIDDDTAVLLNLLADSIGTARILLLVNYRPEYSHRWGNKSYYTQLRLDPLGPESAEEMLDAILTSPAPRSDNLPLARSVAGEGKRGEKPRAGEGSDLAPLKRLIIERTEGNPFFMEETVQALFDEGALIRNGIVRLVKPLADLTIPPTVQAIIASRIDRLPPEHKELVQTLAVIGKEFRLGLIERIASKPDDQLRHELDDLQAAEFIYEQAASGDIEYAFKHALTLEVAYNSILSERRKLLHQHTALAIEQLFSDRLDDHVADLAHHYKQSGEVSKAVHFLRLAGESAVQRSSHQEAGEFFNSALKMLIRLPENRERERTELELRLALLRSLVTTKGYAAAELEDLNRITVELSGQLNDPRLHFTALMFDWAFHQMRRDLESAARSAERALQLANEAADPFLLVHGNYASGVLFLFRGEVGEAIERLEQARQVYQPRPLQDEPQDPGVTSLAFLSLTLWIGGYPDRALSASDEALALARRIAHPLSLAAALTYRALLHLCRREPADAAQSGEEAHDLTTRHGFQYWSALSSTYRNVAIAEMARDGERIADIVESISSYRATGSGLGAGLIMVGLASSYLNAGRTEQVLATVAQALANTERTGAKLSNAELYRLKGEALLRIKSSFAQEARSCFEMAITTARHQQARAWQLRAATSLARLLAGQGRREEARPILAEIYGWFSEGFDTADLQEAKMLLDHLSS